MSKPGKFAAGAVPGEALDGAVGRHSRRGAAGLRTTLRQQLVPPGLAVRSSPARGSGPAAAGLARKLPLDELLVPRLVLDAHQLV